MNIVYIALGIVFLLWILGNLHRKIKRRNKLIHIVESNCTGCQRCIKRCPHKVLEALKEEGKVRIVVKNPNKCSACGDCIAVCKFKALELVSKHTP
ncbi:MAG: 4Fe-4S dicluster domain-containing protein [Candidatus Symbiothrix sp.]|jgi:ferredoxin|nr:4Fe-4S dicluster domain-containing protein [Candidatus Symbiothrix sp.]